jgi:hypothetical protein
MRFFFGFFYGRDLQLEHFERMIPDGTISDPVGPENLVPVWDGWVFLHPISKICSSTFSEFTVPKCRKLLPHSSCWLHCGQVQSNTIAVVMESSKLVIWNMKAGIIQEMNEFATWIVHLPCREQVMGLDEQGLFLVITRITKCTPAWKAPVGSQNKMCCLGAGRTTMCVWLHGHLREFESGIDLANHTFMIFGDCDSQEIRTIGPTWLQNVISKDKLVFGLDGRIAVLDHGVRLFRRIL